MDKMDARMPDYKVAALFSDVVPVLDRRFNLYQSLLNNCSERSPIFPLYTSSVRDFAYTVFDRNLPAPALQLASLRFDLSALRWSQRTIAPLQYTCSPPFRHLSVILNDEDHDEVRHIVPCMRLSAAPVVSVLGSGRGLCHSIHA